jgi:hypothetical protein
MFSPDSFQGTDLCELKHYSVVSLIPGTTIWRTAHMSHLMQDEETTEPTKVPELRTNRDRVLAIPRRHLAPEWLI